MDLQNNDRLLSRNEAAKILGVKMETLASWACTKKKVQRTKKNTMENIKKVSSVIENAKADETLNISTTTDDADIFLNFSIQCKIKDALNLTKMLFKEIGGTQ